MLDVPAPGDLAGDCCRGWEAGPVLVELSVVEQRYHAVMGVLAAGASKMDVAARYGVSRQSVHAWVRRYQADGLPGLADRSHRPKRHPAQMSVGGRGGRM
jgi:hypothetical protein